MINAHVVSAEFLVGHFQQLAQKSRHMLYS